MLEGTSEIPKLIKTIGRDGKAYPAKRPRKSEASQAKGAMGVAMTAMPSGRTGRYGHDDHTFEQFRIAPACYELISSYPAINNSCMGGSMISIGVAPSGFQMITVTPLACVLSRAVRRASLTRPIAELSQITRVSPRRSAL